MADNDGLIKQEIAHLSYGDPYPNITLDPEFDLTEEIYKTHQKYNINASFQHVKGHQDDAIDVHDLPLDAQLNAEADHLSNAFYKEGLLSTPNIIMTPSCKAMLSIQGVSVTSDFLNQLLRAYTEQIYIQHLQEIFHWSLDVTLAISWRGLQWGLNQIQHPCITAKICNNILPMALVLHRWKYENHDSCALCGAQETAIHMIQCSHPSRKKWRLCFISKLRATMTNKTTQLHVQDLLCTAITEWFDTNKVVIQNYPPEFHHALIS